MKRLGLGLVNYAIAFLVFMVGAAVPVYSQEVKDVSGVGGSRGFRE